MSLAAEKDRRGKRPVPIRVRLLRFSGCTYDPNVTCFQLLYQSIEIRYASDGNIFQRSRRDLRDNTRKPNRTTFRDKNTVHSGAFGGAQYRTHVARILDRVQS